MKQTNIIFMGTPAIAVAMLERLLQEEYHVIAVVTQPDKKVGRKQILQMPPVKELAIKHQIPVYQPRKIREEYASLMELDADLIVTCAYGQFIPDELLQYPTYGSINVHASLLPKLRGGAPIHKAIIYGEQETGVSIMRMVAKMDAGAVMSQCKVTITPTDTMGSLYEKLAIAGADLLSTSIPALLDGSAVFVEQEEEKATFAYTISKEEEFIDFDRPIQKVYDHVRGLIPQPVGYALMHGKKIKFHRVRMLQDNQSHTSGMVEGLIDGGYAIAARDGLLLVDELQLEGKTKTDAKSFFNGSGKQFVHQIFNQE